MITREIIDPYYKEYPLLLTTPFTFSVKHLLFLGLLLFIIGLLGISFSKSNAITVLMSIEIMLLGISLSIISFGVFFRVADAFVYALLILALAAAESAIGLSILIVYYRLNDNIFLSSANLLKG